MAIKLNKQLLIIGISFSIIFFGFAGVQQYITTYFSEQGKVNVGFTSLIFIYLFFAISNLFSASFISRYGEKKAIVTGSILYSIYIFSLLTNSTLLVYIFSALLGVGASLLWMGQSNYLIKVSKDTHYGRNSGLVNTIHLTGSAIGLIALGFLIKNISFKSAFLIYAFFPLIGFILLFRLKNLKRSKSKESNFRLIKNTVKNVTALRLAMIWFAFHFAFGLTVGVVPIDVKNNLGITYVGILSSLFYIFPILFSYLIGYISDISGRKNVVIFSYITSIIGLAFLYFNKNAILLILGLIFLALNSAIVKTINSPLIGDFTTKNNMEFLTALFWVVQQIGVVISLFLVRFIQDKRIYLIGIFGIIISFFMVSSLFKFSFKELREKLSREIK